MIEAMMMQGVVPHIELLAVSVKDYQSVGLQLSPEVRRSVPQVLQMVFEIICDLRDRAGDRASW